MSKRTFAALKIGTDAWSSYARDRKLRQWLGSFTPAQLTSLSLWLDADDTSSFTWDSFTELVTAWTDKKGGRVFTPVSTQNNPRTKRLGFKGRYTVSMSSAGGSGMACPTHEINTHFAANGKDQTVFMVLHNDDLTTQFGTVFYHYISGVIGSYFRLNSTAGNERWFNLSLTQGVGTTTDFSGKPRIITLHRSGDTLTTFIDGAQYETKASVATAITSGNSAKFYLGTQTDVGGSGLIGALAEVIVCKEALSQVDRWKVEDYLATKWLEDLA